MIKNKMKAEAAPVSGQHTPGPCKQNIRPDQSMEIQAAAGFPIAVMTMAAHRQANARLIADAPDLLEALKAIAAECERQGETDYTYEIGRTARAAIAQAGGDK
jgi:hypothetical protein